MPSSLSEPHAGLFRWICVVLALSFLCGDVEADAKRDEILEIDDPTVRLLESRFVSYEQSNDDEIHGRTHRVVERVFEVQRADWTRLDDLVTFLGYLHGNFDDIFWSIADSGMLLLKTSLDSIQAVFQKAYIVSFGHFISTVGPNIIANILATHNSLSLHFTGMLYNFFEDAIVREMLSSFAAGLATSILYFYPSWLAVHVLWYSVHGILSGRFFLAIYNIRAFVNVFVLGMSIFLYVYSGLLDQDPFAMICIHGCGSLGYVVFSAYIGLMVLHLLCVARNKNSLDNILQMFFWLLVGIQMYWIKLSPPQGIPLLTTNITLYASILITISTMVSISFVQLSWDQPSPSKFLYDHAFES